MPCYHPMTVWRSKAGRDKKTGKWPIVFNISQGYSDLELKIPCGQCIGCRLERSRQWAVRCIHEAKLSSANCFITLTYSSEFLPSDGSVSVETCQLFLKRLRKAVAPLKIRFFNAGEYGTKLSRPHYHMLIFGYDFPDRKPWSQVHGNIYYRSALLEKLWPYGYSMIGNVSFESAAYVARYIMKKQFGKDADAYYSGRHPEFVTMSRRPGIGFEWFRRFHDDVYPSDLVVVRNNVLCRPPRYYDGLLEATDPDAFRSLKLARLKTLHAHEHDVDNESERLLVREYIKAKKVEKLVRRFHLDMDAIE
nr:MAG: replication initiator protein [Microvirus sp.]